MEVSGVLRLDSAAIARGPGAPFADKEQFGMNADEHGAPYSNGTRRSPYDVQVINLPASIHESMRALLCSSTPLFLWTEQSSVIVRWQVALIMQILVEDPAVGAKSDDPIAQVAKAARAGAGGESERRGVGGDDLSAVLGIVAASSAVTVITTGTVGPVVAFRCFVVMLGGVVAAMSAARGP
jgi:hypothetical protein